VIGALSFLSAGRLWLLVALLALAAAYLIAQGRRKQYAVRFTNLALLDTVAPRRPGWRRHVPAIAFLLAMTALVVGFARPARSERVPRERATIIMAIDVSLSMQATDVAPTRFRAAKAAATSFVDLVPPKLNLGLVAFAGTAQVLVSPTTDHEVLKRSIDALELGPATAIGEAVFAGLSSIASVPTEPGQQPAPARMVLLSDGETTVGRANDLAAKAARDANVPVSTIAFGTDGGRVVVEGNAVRVPVNKEALEQLAEMTGGRAFQAESGKELKDVYSDIGSSVGYQLEHRELTSWFIGLGLLLAMAAAIGSLLWFSRLP
jgi:Ca-activated chloride channel family protein